MEKLNVLLLLTPKKELAYLDDSMSVRQAIEKMKAHSYMAIPLISKVDGAYIGTISEGDLLWFIVANNYDESQLEKINIKYLVRKDFRTACKVDAQIDELLDKIMKQNFVPIVDDRNILMGIVTRKRIIEFLKKN